MEFQMTSQPKFNIVMRLNKEFLNEYKDLSGTIALLRFNIQDTKKK